MSCWTDVNWAAYAIEKLQKGEAASVTPHGESMRGRVDSGQTVELRPSNIAKVDDVVLVKVKGSVYLHLVKAVRLKGARPQYQIGNMKGGINGWVSAEAIYGIANI